MIKPLVFSGEPFAARCRQVAVALALVAAGAGFAHAQQNFQTADEAMAAFGAAVQSSDDAAMKRIFGDKFQKLIPPPVPTSVPGF